MGVSTFVYFGTQILSQDLQFQFADEAAGIGLLEQVECQIFDQFKRETTVEQSLSLFNGLNCCQDIF